MELHMELRVNFAAVRSLHRWRGEITITSSEEREKNVTLFFCLEQVSYRKSNDHCDEPSLEKLWS